MKNSEDLYVQSTHTFDLWRKRYNELVDVSSDVVNIGTIGGLNPEIPEENRQNLVAALNYVYSIRTSEGQPLTDSAFTNCYVPSSTKLYIGSNTDFGIGRTSPGNFSISYENSNLITITPTGFMGLGTSTPSVRLDVIGNMKCRGLSVRNPISNSGLNINNVTIDSIYHTVIDSDAPMIINNSAQPIIMSASNAPVGVGYSDYRDMEHDFNVKSSSSSVTSSIRNLNDVFISTLDISGYRMSMNNSDVVIVAPSGNVGIGSIDPSYKFNVDGSLSSNSITFNTTLNAGSTKFVTITPAGNTNVVLAAGSTLVHGVTPIITTTGKLSSNVYETINSKTINIDASSSLNHGSTTIINSEGKISSDIVEEGSENLYFTSVRVVEALGSESIESISLNSVLNLKPLITRPTVGIDRGAIIMDDTLGLPIFYDGVEWKKFDGTAV